jgi:hypothetical protein
MQSSHACRLQIANGAGQEKSHGDASQGSAPSSSYRDTVLLVGAVVEVDLLLSSIYSSELESILLGGLQKYFK